MTTKKIFVTGAAGRAGIHTIKHLTEGTGLQEGVELWAGIHQAERDEQMNRLAPYKVRTEVIEAGDLRGLKASFKDCQALFLIPSATGDKVQFAKNYIDAAVDCGVEFILLLSTIGVEEKENYVWGCHFMEIEQYLKNSKIPSWCILRTNYFDQNFLLYKNIISNENQLPLPIGKEGKFAPLDLMDLGKAAREVLLNWERYRGMTYSLTGPGPAMNGDEMAKLFSDTLKIPVIFKDVTEQEARQTLKSLCVPPSEIDGLVDYYRLVKAGKMDCICNDLEKIVPASKGRPLSTFISDMKHPFLNRQ